ncbi:MAG: hypothetical protein ACNI25_05540 [Halarcobacter sp.]
MNVSVINSKDQAILSEHLGNDAKIVNIEYRENLHLVEIFSNGNIYRAFGTNNKKALGHAIKAYVRFN